MTYLILIPTFGVPELVEVESGNVPLERFQQLVEGYVKVLAGLPGVPPDVRLAVNDDEMADFALNLLATRMTGWPIVGPAAIFLEQNGDMVGYDESVARSFMAHLARLAG